MKKDKPTVYILWTGGWDSSYRMVELARKNVIVQPLYVYGDGRVSEQYEIRAMHLILKKLKSKKETRAELKPVRFTSKHEILPNKEITFAYNSIAKETGLGSQHEWLARLAYMYPGLELGTESAPLELSRILTAINNYGDLKYDQETATYILDKDKSSNELSLVLGNFRYPIIKKTGSDMLKQIIEWNYEDVMENVWVCHTPIFGKPCGTCHPCELKIETGMGFLMSHGSLKRYNHRKKTPYTYIYSLEKKITQKVDEIRYKI